MENLGVVSVVGPLEYAGVPRPRSSEKSLKVPQHIRRAISDGSLKMVDAGGEVVSIAGFTNELTIHWFSSLIGTEYCQTYVSFHC